MGRYTGPKHRLARREGVNVLDKTSQTLQRRLNVPPGIHGKKRKRALSEFGTQLREKQKAKVMYGLMERQFSNLVKKVQKKKGETGDLLISFLETRLDNIVYRLGFAKSRTMGRQMVGHGHVRVNGKKVTIPSYQVLPSDVVSIGEKIQKNPDIVKLFAEPSPVLGFLERQGPSGKLIRIPHAQDVEVPFDTQLIIEYYSR